MTIKKGGQQTSSLFISYLVYESSQITLEIIREGPKIVLSTKSPDYQWILLTGLSLW